MNAFRPETSVRLGRGRVLQKDQSDSQIFAVTAVPAADADDRRAVAAEIRFAAAAAADSSGDVGLGGVESFSLDAHVGEGHRIESAAAVDVDGAHGISDGSDGLLDGDGLGAVPLAQSLAGGGQVDRLQELDDVIAQEFSQAAAEANQRAVAGQVLKGNLRECSPLDGCGLEAVPNHRT